MICQPFANVRTESCHWFPHRATVAGNEGLRCATTGALFSNRMSLENDLYRVESGTSSVGRPLADRPVLNIYRDAAERPIDINPIGDLHLAWR